MKVFSLFFKKNGKANTMVCEKNDETSSVAVCFLTIDLAEKHKETFSPAHQELFVIKEVEIEDFIKTKERHIETFNSKHKVFLDIRGEVF